MSDNQVADDVGDGGATAVRTTPQRPPADEHRRVEDAAAAAGAAGGWRARLGRAGEVRNVGLIVVLIVIALVGNWSSENFLSRPNITTILVSSAVIGVVTVGMTFVIIGGGIDLSVGAIVALASVWATTLETQSYGPFVMVVCAVLVGAGAGLINGLLIAYGRLVPFIVTLAMLVSARGVAEWISNKRTQIVREEAIKDIARTEVIGVPVLVLILLAVVAVGWFVLNRTTFGRRTFAIGGNAEASRLAGIDVRRHTALLYVISGACCGIAAVMVTARTTTGSSTHGGLYELDAIAAVIIGGTLLAGGRGTLIGSILGVLVFQTVTNIFVLNNLQTEIQNIFKGLIIIAAVLLQRRTQREAST